MELTPEEKQMVEQRRREEIAKAIEAERRRIRWEEEERILDTKPWCACCGRVRRGKGSAYQPGHYIALIQVTPRAMAEPSERTIQWAEVCNECFATLDLTKMLANRGGK